MKRKNRRVNARKTVSDYAIKMLRLEAFCASNGIRTNMYNKDSFYFSVNGQRYRVSNHTVDESNRAAYDDDGNLNRKLHHPDGERDDTIYIHASKTRLEEIYKNLVAGYKLDDYGYVLE